MASSGHFKRSAKKCVALAQCSMIFAKLLPPRFRHVEKRLDAAAGMIGLDIFGVCNDHPLTALASLERQGPADYGPREAMTISSILECRRR
jgi:hypothetical protein